VSGLEAVVSATSSRDPSCPPSRRPTAGIARNHDGERRAGEDADYYRRLKSDEPTHSMSRSSPHEAGLLTSSESHTHATARPSAVRVCAPGRVAPPTRPQRHDEKMIERRRLANAAGLQDVLAPLDGVWDPKHRVTPCSRSSRTSAPVSKSWSRFGGSATITPAWDLRFNVSRRRS